MMDTFWNTQKHQIYHSKKTRRGYCNKIHFALPIGHTTSNSREDKKVGGKYNMKALGNYHINNQNSIAFNNSHF